MTPIKSISLPSFKFLHAAPGFAAFHCFLQMSDHEDFADSEPPTIDPYEVLGLERSATADQVKSAYRKAALKNHPGGLHK